MISVELDSSTKLDSFGIIAAISITDDYVKMHPSAPEVQPLTTDRTSLLWENPLADGEWSSASLGRLHGTFARDMSKYTSTNAVMEWTLDEEALKRLGNEAFMLRGYVEQPGLKALPLYSKFIDDVLALKVPTSRPGKIAQNWSNKASQTWTKIKRSSCDDTPSQHSLLFDLGSHASDFGPDQN